MSDRSRKERKHLLKVFRDVLAFCETMNGWNLLIIFAKSFILHVWQVSEYAHVLAFYCLFENFIVAFTRPCANNYTQVAMRNYWMFVAGCINYVEVFFKADWNKIKSVITWFHFGLLHKPPSHITNEKLISKSYVDMWTISVFSLKRKTTLLMKNM